eukprot:TRINITY_DN69173_c0_g1_i1.p1 TRINITY_DN69173_c0_g1~~TRINITY_DN69173_c0_g1_i1.p1  ORF type:complete len:182 (+),score=31.72 TRINITY_DN69173_c0_g1_i1:72-617(+)
MPDNIDWEDTYTVMMRNLPNKYSVKMLRKEIDAAGFKDEYDFVYLPIDPESQANKGYAFINFTGPEVTQKFRDHFEGNEMKNFNSNKVVAIAQADIQGYDALYKKFSSKRVSKGDKSARPLFLRDGDGADDDDEEEEVRPKAKKRRVGGGGSQSTICRSCGSTVAVHLGYSVCLLCRAPCY